MATCLPLRHWQFVGNLHYSVNGRLLACMHSKASWSVLQDSCTTYEIYAARRLWACLIARPCIKSDPQMAFSLLHASASKTFITTADMAALLTDSFPTLDPATIAHKAFECFEWFLQKVGPDLILLSCFYPYVLH